MNEPEVYGLFAIPISTPDGELIDFVLKYGNELGDSGGQVLLWRPLGDPRRTDAVYKKQRTKALELADGVYINEYKQEIARSGSSAHHRRGEVLQLRKRFGLQQEDLPLIVFYAGDPVNEKAILHIPEHIFTNKQHCRNLLLLLSHKLSESMILQFASSGAFTKMSMLKLQSYFIDIEKIIVLLGEPEISGIIEDNNRDRNDSRLHAEESDVDCINNYALYYSRGMSIIPLSKDKYKELVCSYNQYDIIIDGVARKCYKRDCASSAHQEKLLTPSEFNIIRDFVAHEGIHRPMKFRNCSKGRAMSAIRLFDSARKKVDIRLSTGEFMLFRTHGGRTPELRRYEFAPPEEIKWTLIELADS